MEQRPDDLDASRLAISNRQLVAAASAHLTAEVAMSLPFHELVPYKTLLKRFFSAAPWTADDEARMSSIVVANHAGEGWWEHDLGEGLTLAHGFRRGRYLLWATGAGPANLPLDRFFTGPVTPEATPHPRKIKFNIGGTPAPGIWYRRADEVGDPSAAALFDHPDVTDVMVAGDFVTVGLRPGADWEDRIDEMIERVTSLFWDPGRVGAGPPARTRDELVGEGLRTSSPAELHLLDPDDTEHRARLGEALHHADAAVRRVALATLAQSSDLAFVVGMLHSAYTDRHRIVRRMAIDAAADLGDDAARPILLSALADRDAWIRWKAVRGLAELGLGSSREAVAALGDDEDFQVRLEVTAALQPRG